MTGRPTRKPRPPLDAEKLQNMALRYVERFATSRAKLADYLERKVRERGWGGESQPDIDALVVRFSDLGYVDDRSFALAKARSLTTRGLGARRVRQALHQAGIGEDDRSDADRHVEEESLDAALRFARRKRLGPFATHPHDRQSKEKALAAMVRAGHGFDVSRRIVELAPGADLDSLNTG